MKRSILLSRFLKFDFFPLNVNTRGRRLLRYTADYNIVLVTIKKSRDNALLITLFDLIFMFVDKIETRRYILQDMF